MATSLFLGLAYLCLLFCPPTTVVSQSPVAYYIFVLQWPPAVCPTFYYNCICPLPNFPTIHGLWPKTANGADPPIRNPADRFNVKQFVNLVPELDWKWPTLFLQYTNRYFWQHEWFTDGRRSDFGQRKYFHKTLDVYSMIDLMNRMAHVGLYPGSRTLQTINTSLTAEYGGMVQIICTTNYNAPTQVKELRFNVTFDAAGQPQVHPFLVQDQSCQPYFGNGFHLGFLI